MWTRSCATVGLELSGSQDVACVSVYNLVHAPVSKPRPACSSPQTECRLAVLRTTNSYLQLFQYSDPYDTNSSSPSCTSLDAINQTRAPLPVV